MEDCSVTDGCLTVVLKYDKDYAAPWATFRGSHGDVRRSILEFVGLDAADAEGLSLADVVLNASQYVKTLGTTGRSLGATVIRPNVATQAPPAGQQDVWTQASLAIPPAPAAQAEVLVEPPSPVDAMVKRIEATGDIPALQRLWAEHRLLFEANPDLLASWKARGRAIQGTVR